MQFTTFFATVALSFISVVSGAIIPRSAKDVFVPTILTPTADTIWVMGTNASVTWKTDNAPVNISNGASVFLKGYGNLAQGFSLRDGSVTFEVPFLYSTVFNPEEKHQIILFGDSGNDSANFTIKFDPEVVVNKALGKA
ncbi:hypothetical protein DXG01_011685 [Tephrocybe rancida]|nr:hypothetical protein DXG01_011685 [Tephrocybe rancida]